MPTIKSITAEYSCSAQIKDTWHRIGFTLTLDLTPDEQTKEAFAEVKKKAWDIVEAEVEKQLGSLVP